jgi:hypothetical protein
MVTDRELKFLLAHITDQPERTVDMLTAMDGIIAGSASLNADKRNIISITHKA